MITQIIEVDTSVVEAALGRVSPQALGDDIGTLVAEIVEGQMKRRVAVEKTAPDGSAWAPWAPSTAARRKGGSLLVDTGEMLGSIAGDGGFFLSTVVVATDYAGYHQDGTKFMPARPIAGISEANARELEQAVEGYIGRLLQ